MYHYKCGSCMKTFASPHRYVNAMSGGRCPRCGTMITGVHLVRGPRVEDLAPILNVINPRHGLNPEGNCMDCAIETAQALTSGAMPQMVQGWGANVGDAAPFAGTVIPQVNRHQLLAHYLNVAAPGSVFAVDADDHAYNFVKGPHGHIFVVDSNQHCYRWVRAQNEYVAYMANDSLQDGLRYDYADPPSESDDMEVFYWGALHANYQRFFENR